MSRPDHSTNCLLTVLFGRDLIDRQPLSVAGHHQFRESIAAPSRNFDEIDDECAVDPYVTGTSSRRSDKELARMLDLIDSLPISDSGKDGFQ